MKIDESLYRTFLEEMNELENFRVAYASLKPGVPLDREDPDVKRLIEAMALFSARTRLAGTRNIVAMRRRIFQQFFPYLLNSLPSMAILQASLTGQLAEPFFFPKGSEIAVSPEKGGTALFQTLHDLTILPVTLSDFRMLLMPERGFRLALNIRAPFVRSEKINRISFFINHLNNYEASQLVLYNLKHHIRHASVVFDEKVSETTSPGEMCKLSYGISPDADDYSHPLQRERLFFHFPWQESFMHVEIPTQPDTWTNFTICLDLDGDWPRNLVLNREVFQLFAVPIINLRKAMAQPIVCTGTRESYAVRNPDVQAGFRAHSIQGVYEVTKQGTISVKSGILSGATPSYESEEKTDDKGAKQTFLNIQFPKAFEEAKTILVDTLWIQPWFSDMLSHRLTYMPFTRTSIGMKWESVIDPVPHAESEFQDNLDAYLHFFALTNRETLTCDDLLDILQIMGVTRQVQFNQLCNLLVNVRIESGASEGSILSDQIRHRYILRFQEYDPSLEPLMEIFLAHVETILDALISGAKVEVQKKVTG